MYLRLLPNHAWSVPLVLKLQTGNITAQWNVVFDDWFLMVNTQTNDLPNFNADEWANMFGTSTYCIPVQFDSKNLIQLPQHQQRENLTNPCLMNLSNKILHCQNLELSLVRLTQQLFRDRVKSKKKKPSQIDTTIITQTKSINKSQSW